MGLKEDALDFAKSEALPDWEKAAKKRDPYIPRTLIPKKEHESSRRGGVFSLLGFTEIKDENLVDLSEAVVLGRAGAGKSYLLLRGYGDALNLFIDRDGDAPFPLYLDCSSHTIPASKSIREAILAQPSGDLYKHIAAAHSHGIHLFIDEADTRIRQDPSFAISLEAALQEMQDEVSNLHFLISSREREWNDFSKLKRWAQQGDIELLAFPDQPIGKEYSHLIPDVEQRKSFFEECRKRGFFDLLSLAFDGFELARKFNESGQLPSTREELWDQRINARLVKSDADIEIAQAPSRHRLRYLAGLMACLSYLAGQETWSVRDAIDELSKPLVGHEQPVTPAEVNWLLQSRLFSLAEGDRYRFIHNRYRDKLVAEKLHSVKTRKQRSLLIAETLHGRERIVPELRTVAATLATIDNHGAFREHLVENEPEVAIFGSLPRLSSDERKELLSAVIEWGRKGHHPPWFEIQGIGERIDSALSRHCPSDPGSFLKRYLTSDDDMERLWAATLAVQWGGVSDAGDQLAQAATDEEEKTGTRKRALEALEKNGDSTYAHIAESLLDHDDDEVRGHALRAWRSLSDVSPEEYVSALAKDRSQQDFYGTLLRDPRRYAETLGKEEVEEAFEALSDRLSQASKDQDHNPLRPLPGFNSLHESLLEGLLIQVENISSDVDLPISFLTDFFVRPSVGRTSNKEFVSALSAHPKLWHQVLESALERCQDLGQSLTNLSNLLAESIPGAPEEVLPNDKLSNSQRVFVNRLEGQVEYNQRVSTNDTNSIRPSDFLSSMRTDQDKRSNLPSSVTKEKVDKRINDLLSSRSSSAEEGAEELLKEFWRIRAQVEDSISEVDAFGLETFNPADLGAMIDMLDDAEQGQVVRTLVNSFPSVADKPFARPVAKYLIDREVELPADALIDFLESSRFWTDDTRSELEKGILTYLREQDRERWEEAVSLLASDNADKRYRILCHLVEESDSFYLSKAKSRLHTSNFENRREWRVLVEYVIQQEPDDLNDTLVKALQQIISNSTNAPVSCWDMVHLLFELIERNDDRGWEMLEEQLKKGALPLSGDLRPTNRQIPEPDTKEELQTLVQWYRKIRINRDQSGADPLAAEIMDRIVGHASLQAVEAVWDLQQSSDFEGAEWLSGRCLDAEDAKLAQARDRHPPRRLLEFILTDHFHLVESNQGLYEVLLQVFDDLQEEYKQGQGVAGFWKPVPPKSNSNYATASDSDRTFTDQPRNEEECQNMLWAMVRPRLRAYGLTDVEEDVIGPDYADLRVEHAQPGRAAHQVFVEVKVARRNYAKARLVDPLKNQLWKKYLGPSSSNHGIYVVIWAKDPERHDWPAGYDSPIDLKRALSEKAECVREKHGTVIQPVVLDVSANYRSSSRS